MSQKKEKGVSARWRDGGKGIETQREDVWKNCPLDNHSSCPFLSFLMDVFSGYFISHVKQGSKRPPCCDNGHRTIQNQFRTSTSQKPPDCCQQNQTYNRILCTSLVNNRLGGFLFVCFDFFAVILTVHD